MKMMLVQQLGQSYKARSLAEQPALNALVFVHPYLFEQLFTYLFPTHATTICCIPCTCTERALVA
jgi:hypothetical protein